MQRRLIFIFALLLAIPVQAQISLGLINDFNNSNVEGWRHGVDHEGAPAVIETGGPAGDGDGFLRIISTGAGQVGSRLAAMNQTASAWAGDYISADVVRIRVDLRNSGSNPATIRMAFSNTGGISGNWWVTKQSIVLPANSDWQTEAIFSLAENDLSQVQGTIDYQTTFSNIVEARILVNPAESFQGEAVAHTIDCNNFTMLAAIVDNDITEIPTLSEWAMILMIGLLLLWGAVSVRHNH